MQGIHDRAVVLFSGGQDSSICLAWALNRFARVDTLGFDYGQTHSVEMRCRGIVREAMVQIMPSWAPCLGDDSIFHTDIFKQFRPTALTGSMPVTPSSIEENLSVPNTFVPGRNVLFLNLAALWAWDKGIRHIILGVCEVDSSGYPDCRDDAIKAVQLALNCGMGAAFVLHTPLMWRDKAQSWALAHQLGGDALVDMLVEHTHSCYVGERDTRHVWGYGCGQCMACHLRAKGYAMYIQRQGAAS